MTEGGYIRLYRRLLDSPIWTRLTPGALKVAVYFLLKANWRSSDWYDGRLLVTIPRGSFITSYPSAAEGCHLTSKQARAAFTHLERVGFATYTRGRHWTMVDVTNYDDYQGEIEAESRAGTLNKTGQDEGRHLGTMKGSLISPVTPPFRPLTKNDESDRAGTWAGLNQQTGQDGGSLNARSRAPEEEIKKLRSNTCASDDAPAGELPSLDDPPFESLPVERRSSPAGSRKAKLKSKDSLTSEQSAWFDRFWDTYWLHRAKKPARQAFGKHVNTTTRFDQVMAAVEAQSAEMFSRPPEKRPHGATWLNQERWDDGIDAQPAPSAPSTPGLWGKPMPSYRKPVD